MGLVACREALVQKSEAGTTRPRPRRQHDLNKQRMIAAAALAALTLGISGGSHAKQVWAEEPITNRITVTAETVDRSATNEISPLEELDTIKIYCRLGEAVDKLSLTDAQKEALLNHILDGDSYAFTMRSAEAQAAANKEVDSKLIAQSDKLISEAKSNLDTAKLDEAKVQLDGVLLADTAPSLKKIEAAAAAIKAEQERIAAEEAAAKAVEEKAAAEAAAAQAAQANGTPYFGSDGLLVERTSSTAERVITLLLNIPGHANGAGYHASTGLDDMINSLSVEEATHVIHRIEGAGFGQTGAGWAGIDSTASHQAFLDQQVHGRFDGSIHALLRAWGTFSYGGY